MTTLPARRAWGELVNVSLVSPEAWDTLWGRLVPTVGLGVLAWMFRANTTLSVSAGAGAAYFAMRGRTFGLPRYLEPVLAHMQRGDPITQAEADGIFEAWTRCVLDPTNCSEDMDTLKGLHDTYQRSGRIIPLKRRLADLRSTPGREVVTLETWDRFHGGQLLPLLARLLRERSAALTGADRARVVAALPLAQTLVAGAVPGAGRYEWTLDPEGP